MAQRPDSWKSPLFSVRKSVGHSRVAGGPGPALARAEPEDEGEQAVTMVRFHGMSPSGLAA